MRALIRLAGRCPPWLVDGIGATLGAIWHAVIPIRRRVARENVRRALGLDGPATRRLVRRAYRHYGRSVAEALRAAGGRPPALEVHGEAHLRAALAEGRGVLALSAHLGSFEALLRAAAGFDVPVHVITKRFSAAGAQRGWASLRLGGPGLFSAGSARAIRAALARGEIVADVLDQHAPPGRAVWVPFFGRPAATLPDLVRLSHQTGAAVVPIFTHRRAGRQIVSIQPALRLSADQLAAVAQCVAVVEAAIRARPSQWLWIHRRWKPIPPDVQAALTDGRAGRRRALTAAGRASSAPPRAADRSRAPSPTPAARPGSRPAAPAPPPG